MEVFEQTEVATDLQLIYERARNHAPVVKQESIKTRKKKLKQLLKETEAHRMNLREAIYEDFKKPAVEVDVTDYFPVITEIKHAIRHLNSWTKEKPVRKNLVNFHLSASIKYEPKGACLILSPWNFPFNLTMGPLVSAIAAGNTVVLKPSEFTPATNRVIRSILEKVFRPEEVCLVEGDHLVASTLTSFPFDHIFFTGSPSVGKKVMAEAAKNLSTVTLELGGKSPTIIDKSASIKSAASKIAWGKFFNNGQTCVAPDYLLVHESVKERFIEELTNRLESFYGSESERQKSAHYARLIHDRHHDRLTSLIDDALQHGAKLVAGNSRDADERYISPTILDHCTFDMQIMQEEIFGPVLPIITYSSEIDAVNSINSLPKPLALYVFARDKKKAEYFLNNSSAGGSCVNDCIVQFNHQNLHFGGANNSVFGNSHG
jgi:aldehyde dehydrogenase (NAD+)